MQAMKMLYAMDVPIASGMARIKRSVDNEDMFPYAMFVEKPPSSGKFGAPKGSIVTMLSTIKTMIPDHQKDRMMGARWGDLRLLHHVPLGPGFSALRPAQSAHATYWPTYPDSIQLAALSVALATLRLSKVCI